MGIDDQKTDISWRQWADLLQELVANLEKRVALIEAVLGTEEKADGRD